MTLGQVQDPVSGTDRHRWDLDWTRHPDPGTGSTSAVHGTDARDLGNITTTGNSWQPVVKLDNTSTPTNGGGDVTMMVLAMPGATSHPGPMVGCTKT